MTGQLSQYYAFSALAAVGIVSILTYLYKKQIKGNQQGGKENPINPDIRKEEKKVRDVLDIEDVVSMINSDGKISLCRCWRSQKWPYCDGAHKQFNKCSGDNTGPINIVKKKKAATS